MLLQDNRFSVNVDEKCGCIRSLIGSLPGYTEVDFCDPRPLKSSLSLFWGEVIIGDEICNYRSTCGKTTISDKKNEVTALYELEDFSVNVRREFFEEYFDETYKLISKNTFTLTNFGIVFRPAMGVLVGEHEAYKVVNFTPTVYHWFTGDNLAYLCITHSNGNPPHLAIVLVDGSINGISFPYVYQWSISDPLSCFPILHVTGLALHKEEDEYPQHHLLR